MKRINRINLRYSLLALCFISTAVVGQNVVPVGNAQLGKESQNVNTSISEKLIVADNADPTGVYSAYDKYSFHISTQCENPVWKYVLPLNDGTETIVSSATEPSFRIFPITNEDRYKRSEKGNVTGKIELECTKDGNIYSEEYIITLDLKPRILDVEILDMEILPDSYANYTVAVSYQGCHTLKCLLEEEFASGATQFVSKDPLYTEFGLSNVDIYGQVWLHLYAWNDYGCDVLEYELPTNEDIANSTGKYIQSDIDNYRVKEIQDYNINGMLLRSIKNENELHGKAGEIHILKYIDEGGNTVGIHKVILR